ncbi:hypothetical protein SEEPBA42_03354 [Salmonella enterica subsp. enterica serovar Paratyphi B str. SARA42]|nr:hypothetical protein SEEPBA42_03354 [Salmonella enterica subsp. enterica serovar Paratyphi B str. SARA42]
MRYRVILFCLFGLLPVQLLWAAPAQRTFSDWQVTCNNQNFCVARNTGEHHGLVMTLSRSAGARTDAVLRIDRGGLAPPDAKEAAIAPRLLLDGKPLSFNSPHWRVSPWHLMTGDPATITAFLQTIQDAQAITLKKRRSDAFAGGIKSGITVYRRATKTCGQRNRLD